MSYKFYKSTTTRNLELVDGVGVSFELTNSNKNHVYILTDLYTSSYKFPISLGLIKRIGDNVNYGYGEGTNLNIVYRINNTNLGSDKLIITHPTMETEEFIKEGEIYKSKTSDNFIIENESKYSFETKDLSVVFEKGSAFGEFKNKYIIYKQNGNYTLILSYHGSGRLEKIENEAFVSCGQLNIVQLNEGLKVIGNSSFYNCTSLK